MRVFRIGNTLLPALLSFAAACTSTEPVNLPPVLSITQPEIYHVVDVGDVVEIVAEASDSDGFVASVSFFANGRFLGQDSERPYTLSWNTTDVEGWQNRVKAVARDDMGASGEDAVRVQTNWVCRPPVVTADGWETASLEEVDLDPEPLADLMNSLRDNPGHLVHGVVVARHGLLVFEQYFDGLSHPTWGETPVSFDRDTPHVLSSVTKSFTAALFGIAIDHRFISSVDEKVFDFFPELAELNTGQKQDITLEHLVTMSSGLEWDESASTLRTGNDLTRLIAQAGSPHRNLVGFVLGKDLVADPGSVFLYSGGLTNVLGNVIQRATGQRLDEFANDYLFHPLGITDAWWWLLRPDFVYASGDLALLPRDMARFGQLFLQQGRWNDEQLVSEEWVTQSAAPRFEFSETHWALTYGHRGYSHGWWPNLDRYGEGAFAASGWGGQTIVVLPEHDMVVAITGGSYWETPFLNYDQIMTNYILRALR